MRRREFLLASASGLTSAILPPTALGDSKPCPPSTLSIGEGASISSSCGEVSGIEVPPWFADAPEGAWIETAAGAERTDLPPAKRGARLVDRNPSQFAGFDDITGSWTGGCVDQIRGEQILAANGGHANYYGNEVYALALREEVPGWVRLTDPTPKEYFRLDVVGQAPAYHTDGPGGVGRMRSVHGYNRCCFGNGKVWYAGQDAYSGNGSSGPGIWSFDRDYVDAERARRGLTTAQPLPHTPDNPMPWVSHGITNDFGQFGPAAFDRATGKIWAIGGNRADDLAVWCVDTNTMPATTKSWRVRAVADGRRGEFFYACAAIAHDLRIMLVPETGSNSDNPCPRIWVLRLDQEPGSAGWFAPVTPEPLMQWSGAGRPGDNQGAYGAVYLESMKSVLLYEPVLLGQIGKGAHLRRLQIPTNSGRFAPEGTFRWSEIAPAVGGVDPVASSTDLRVGFHGVFSKFNLIEDMGSQSGVIRSALVCTTDTKGPTYVYKLPLA